MLKNVKKDIAEKMFDRLIGQNDDMPDFKRRSGRTTRMVDAAIQSLFRNKRIIFSDHELSLSHGALSIAFAIFKKRMAFEHPHVRYKATKVGMGNHVEIQLISDVY